MTYKHCAFFSDSMVARMVRGAFFCVHRCTNPGCIGGACYPSHPSHPDKGKFIGDICPLFRIRSVMNSFDTEKKDGGRGRGL